MTTNSDLQKHPLDWLVVFILGGTFVASLTFVPYYGFVYGYDLFEWSIFTVLMIFSGISITGGYHRMWAHKAYKGHFILRVFYALFGACALESTILDFATHHRQHHKHVDDKELDPYAITRGFWFAHFAWMLPLNKRRAYGDVIDYSNAKDLFRDPIVTWQQKYYLILVLVMNIALPAFLGWLNGDILGMLLLAGVLRIVLTHHFTWFINSLAHMWGARPYNEVITARDNGFLALFTWGEGYHNYHHHFQWDYRNGVRWWQYDPTKWLIYSCSLIGLASDLKRVPDEKILAAKQAVNENAKNPFETTTHEKAVIQDS